MGAFHTAQAARGIPRNDLPRWTAPAPRELHAVRDGLAKYLLSTDALMYTAALVGSGAGTLTPPAPTPLASAMILHTEEHRRLTSARLFYFTPAMTDLAVTAGAQLPDWDVDPRDVPADQGFMLFGEPIGGYRNNDGDAVSIVACSWGRSMAESSQGGVWVTFWSQTLYGQLIEGLRKWHSLADATRIARAGRAELTWDNEVLLGWHASDIRVANGRSYVPSEGGVLAAESTIGWAQIVRAAWLLTQQRDMADVTELHLSKGTYRRAVRDGCNPASIRVVDICRSSAPRKSDTTATGRPIGVRYFVDGYWRQQPYGPGRSLRERRYVRGGWRGPEDAPLSPYIKVNLVAADGDSRPVGSEGRG